jgi:exodeoxyribonuclease VII large subunit
LQLVVDSLRRAGAGSLYEEFLRLKAKLQAQGLFDAGRKRPIATHPQGVGIATSLQAAALHDVLTVFSRRAPHVRLVVYPCAVQGAQAVEQICRAIETASERREVDTLIVCRGGGSMEDLWAYNAEAVAHAIARCAVPVISGVGHETDVTLADFVADLRAPTPSAAAELAAQSQAEGLQDLQPRAQRLQRWTCHGLDTCAQRLDGAALRLGRPQGVVEQHRERWIQLSRRLAQALPRALQAGTVDLTHLGQRFPWAAEQSREARRHRLESLAVRLQAMDPRGVLRRGYAWLSTEDGLPLVRAAQARPGQVLTAHLAD